MLSSALHALLFIGVSLHALQRRRNASATILWIFVAWSIPLFGPLLYLAFGIDRVSVKGRKRQIDNQRLIHQRDQRHKDDSSFNAWHMDFRTELSAQKNLLSRNLNMVIDACNPEHPLLDGNHITPLVSGDEAYPLMLQAIRSAQSHIHLQSFIIHYDEVGIKFLDELKAKAEEGVKVRLLFDRFGSTHAYLGGMFRKYHKTPNFEICGWTQANPFKAQFQINLRNHRKTMIVDGHIAFFGGVNLANENTTINGHKAIRDYHFKSEGPLVHELQLSFLSDWHFMTRQPIDALLKAELFPRMLSLGQARARLIDSGPASQPNIISDTFFNAITMAQSQIQIVTPYFIPPNEILKALRSAAQRGVDVQIVVPQFNNHKYAGLATEALFEELLTVGVRVFHRKSPFIHAKAMIIDNSIALIGTANIDVRSLELNYETTVLIEGGETVDQIKRLVLEDISESDELNLNDWLKRPKIQKLGENICALMTPVL
ncbi:MAG TPA: cardiolipin synthase [Pontiella sp.]